MLDADEVCGVADGFYDALGVVAADDGVPEPDADESAGGGDAFDLVIGEVAGVVAGATDAGVGDDDGQAAECEDFVDNFRGGVGEIDEDVEVLHELDDLASGGGESAFFDAVCGAADVVVEEVGWGHHAVADVEEELHADHVAFEAVEAFDAEDACGDVGVLGAFVLVAGEVFFGFEEGEGVRFANGDFVEFGGLVHGAL